MLLTSDIMILYPQVFDIPLGDTEWDLKSCQIRFTNHWPHNDISSIIGFTRI
jgi:hypothetical protein